MTEFISDFLQFVKVRKNYWLVPIVLVLLLVALIIMWGPAPLIAPFVYTLY